ncbi:MAG: hypothetical protein CMI09_08005 [Oceanospirillaceae bacterium]|nr:hypothetical protein [Oceanospirillaceae bacterium]|tara:strand:- start:608 stop:1522 length:915 start_codon:yes stop_codon:yes gene_type:complete
MSIVICKTIDKKVFIHSDTRGWNSIAERSDIFKGLLKIVILSPTICICWAGNAETAKDAFNGIEDRWIKENDTASLCTHLSLFSMSDQLDHHVDFIIIDHSSDAKTFKITKGKIQNKNPGFTWIGDYDAYHLFLEKWHQTLSTKDPEEYIAFHKAFKIMIENAPSKTVGDFQVSVVSNDEGFRYTTYGEAFSPKQTLSPGTSVLKLQGCAEGAYSLSCLTTNANEKPGCALYFTPIEFGVILDPSDPFHFGPILHLPINTFLSEVKRIYGFDLSGRVVDSSGQIRSVGKRTIDVSLMGSTIIKV